MAYQTLPLVNAPYTPTIRYNCRDNAKLTSRGPARYKIEWIYMRTKVSGPDSLELAPVMPEKERKKERMRNGHFFNIWFWRVQLIWWMIFRFFIDNLLEIPIFTLRNFTKMILYFFQKFGMKIKYCFSFTEFLEVNIHYSVCVRIPFPFIAYTHDDLCRKIGDYIQSFGKGCRIIRRAEVLQEIRYLFWDILEFIVYYIIIWHIRVIPTYRVYQLW